MAATGRTDNYKYRIYEPDDITSWLTDFNGNWEQADKQFKELEDKIGTGGGGAEVVQTTGTSMTAVMSQNAVTTQLNAINVQISGVELSLTKLNTGTGV